MKQIALCLGVIVLVAVVFVSTSPADAPPENSIPIIAMKTGQGTTSQDVTLQFICELLWRYFDGVWLEGWVMGCQNNAIELSDSAGAFVVLAPSLLQALNNDSTNRWGRYDGEAALQDSDAFIHSLDFTDIDGIRDAAEMMDSILWRCVALADRASNYDCIWYYDIFNEAPSWQLNGMNDPLAYSQYFPSVFTQDTSMSTVDADGIFSWILWKSDSIDSSHAVSITFGGLHTIEADTWADLQESVIGTTHNQANSVRAFAGTQYQAYQSSPPLDPVDNLPQVLGYNAYAFRLAGYYWQTRNDTTATLGGELDRWMLNHYEEIMDSTFIPAATCGEDPLPVHYHPQSFGRTGGTAIWDIDVEDGDTTLTVNYYSYSYRIPSPAEFRMLCNLALLRQAKGIFPYSIRSYEAWKEDTLLHHDTGLLDEDLIAFDAPYEDWVYRERPTGDFWYAPPDSIPPWTDVEGNDFDPLYELPDRGNWTGEQATQDYLEWKFAPYARLWNSLRETFGSIAWIAPELSGLWWYDGYEDVADITCIDSVMYQSIEYIGPEIKVFGDSNACFLFYVNRYCRVNSVPFRISIDEDSLPSGVVTNYLLNHSARCIMPVDSVSEAGVHFFSDTLEAGEGRLVQFVGSSIAADARLTRPDVYAACGALFSTRDFEFTAGDDIDVNAIVYNMGTSQQANVRVRLLDDSEHARVDSMLFTLPALSTSSYTCACDTVTLDWDTDSTDIGIHLMRVEVVSWFGEPDTTDNSATLTFLIRPRDYATEVREDAWDMTEAVSSPPAWKTNDISDESGWTSYTDSISGMFEGVIDEDSLTTNRLYLDLDGTTNIVGDLYNQVSLACISMDASCDVIIGWEDTAHHAGTDTLFEDLPAGEWIEIGPYDLSGSWNHRTIETLWLRFSYTSEVENRVRIGWVRLEEEGS